jgi:hypothetical protein
LHRLRRHPPRWLLGMPPMWRCRSGRVCGAFSRARTTAHKLVEEGPFTEKAGHAVTSSPLQPFPRCGIVLRNKLKEYGGRFAPKRSKECGCAQKSPW